MFKLPYIYKELFVIDWWGNHSVLAYREGACNMSNKRNSVPEIN